MSIVYIIHAHEPVYAISGDAWQVVSGASHCQIVDKGLCVTDGVGQYGHNEKCRVKALADFTITAKQFELENCCDKIEIGGKSYTGETVEVHPGSEFVWSSDGSVAEDGFKVCAQQLNNGTMRFVCLMLRLLCAFYCIRFCFRVSFCFLSHSLHFCLFFTSGYPNVVYLHACIL